ncbi:MAG: hypothetical protein JWP57_399 [Spirosoma sp.]|nr:hypothetical protein [Spirosoma sp.]
MKRFIYLFLLLVIPFATLAQAVRISDKPEQFMADMQKLMATGGPVAVRAGANIQTVWSGNKLSAQQQERVMTLSRKMNQKRMLPAAQFAPLYESLYLAISSQQPTLGPADLDGLLTVAEKLFETTDTRTFTRSLETVRRFLERRELYVGSQNKLYALGGTFQFRDAGTLQPVVPNGSQPPLDSATAAKAAAERSRFDGWDDPVPADSGRSRSLGVQYATQRRPIPAVSGPVITLSNTSLAMVATGVGRSADVAKADSAVLSGTSGDLLLSEGVFVGKGGKFTWESVERPDIFVTFSDYALTVANPRLLADDVTLTYPPSKPIKGVFEYVSKKKGGPATYPRFMSWQNDVKIPGLGTDIDYQGGLTLLGTQMVGASASRRPSVLTVKQNGKPAFKASSQKFDFRDSLITAQSTAFVGYVDQDSVTHPAVQFKFDKVQRIAWLNRLDKSQYARVPYADSYHKFYITPEVTRWDLSRRKVDFYQIGDKREIPVEFESFDYFQPQRYSDLTVDYGFHPLQIVANYVSTKKQQTFTDDDITRSVKVNPVALRGALNRMVIEGYLTRDADSGLMRLSRKGILYVLAYARKSDYDNLAMRSLFVSNDSTKNATINLADNIMTIRGVERFTLSDSLKVVAIPSDKVMRVGKGRALTFNGQLKAGTLRYTGQDLKFDYDKFAMNINRIDSITFSSAKPTAQGKEGEMGGDVKYDNPGTVFLGAADNKSGMIKGKKTTQRLVIPKGITVYFNQPNRGNMVYNEKVYFNIPAIDNDSLGKGSIAFVGTFYSDGIFPPFKAELQTMPDNTLGFVHKAPAAGYPLYKKPGSAGPSNVKLTSEIVMDKSGLHAEGTLNHYSASLKTGRILFMTDSLVAAGPTGEIKEGLVGKAYFPQIKLNDYSLKWWPKADSMVITTQKNNFNFYNATTNLEGGLVIRSSGLFGNGTLRRKDLEAVSNSIKFNKEGFLADNAQFKIVSDREATRPILLGNEIDMDFNQKKGIVGLAINKRSQQLSDTLQPSLEFPAAAYKTNINRAQWNMNAKTISMKGDVKTSTFTATAAEQEGLTFHGSSALYDVEKMMLNISGVPYVTSADARIFPDKGVVTIKRNGEMLALKNARLELDTVSLFHRLRGGNIQVISRTRFAGDAAYQFATMKGDTASIKMGSFELKEAPSVASTALTADAKKPRRSGRSATAPGSALTTYYTVARADVNEADNLQLAPKMLFKGSVSMQAPQKDLALDGFIKPALKKRPDLVGGWIPFKEKVVERLEIKVDKNLKNEGGQQLVAGIHVRGNGTGLYPTFLSPKEDSRDEDLFSATGIMRYDDAGKVYRIMSKAGDVPTADAAAKTDSVGSVESDEVENAFTFNDARGLMTYKGKLNLLSSAPKEYLLASGSARINIDSTTYRLNTLLAFTFPVPEPISTAIAGKLVAANLEEKNDEAAEDDLNRLSDKLVPLIGQAAVDAYRLKAQNQHVPLNTAAPLLNSMLVLANANLRWSSKFNSFYSTGRLGVSNMGATDVNAQMDGFVEIRKTSNGDEATIYLESSADVWAFYDYKPGNGPKSIGQLAIITSEQDINDRLMAGSRNRGKATIAVVSATVDEKSMFVDRYLDQYKTKARTAPKPKARPAEVTPPVAATPADSSAVKTVESEAPKPESETPNEEVTKKTDTKAPQKSTKTQEVAPTPPAGTKVVKEEKKEVKKKDKEEEKEGF